MKITAPRSVPTFCLSVNAFLVTAGALVPQGGTQMWRALRKKQNKASAEEDPVAAAQRQPVTPAAALPGPPAAVVALAGWAASKTFPNASGPDSGV